MRVGNLYKNLDLKVNHIISKVVSNSKEAINDSIFVAIKGYCDNGEKYIDEAIELGAKTIITSSDFITEKNINVIKAIGVSCNCFFYKLGINIAHCLK